jgi:heme/copper-type cytochrome/quinol oxidase subunit 3
MLDWATPTPPPDEGYRVLPVVSSRYPLWEQPRLDAGDPRYERIVRGLGESPTGWRAQLITSVLTAEPQAVVQLSGPSIWPLIAAIVLTLNFVATLFDIYWLLALSLVGTVGATIGWLWPTREDREHRLTDEGTGEGTAGEVHGLPVYTSGTSSPAWWTMLHVILVVAVATACLVMSYFYLRAGAAAWPPAGFAVPDALLPGAATLLLVAGTLAAWWAERRIRRGAQTHLKLGLGVATAAVAAFLAFLILHMAGGVSPSAHAYGSSVQTLLGYQAVLVVAGLVLLGVVLTQAFLGYFDARRFLAVQNTAMFLTAAAANWLVVYGVVHLSPYVL